MSRPEFPDLLDRFERSDRVAIAGFGKTGRSVLNFILERYPGKSVFVFDDIPVGNQDKLEGEERKDVVFLHGESDFSRLQDADFIVISPGVNGRESRFDVIRQRKIPLISEIELAACFIQSDIIAVTGTNGKSTTVSLIHHLLRENDLDVILAGNIGNPLLSEVNRFKAGTRIVLEASSFQLEEIIHFRPHIASVLNITPDHLDRYPDFDEYVAAKMRISENQTGEDYLIYNHDDDLLRRVIQTKARKIGFSTVSRMDQGFYVEDGFVVDRSGEKAVKISLKNNTLPGVHNLENVLTSIIVARLQGIPPDNIERAMASFKGLPHRIERLGKIGTVEYINDSKATNIDAALKSLLSFNSPVVLILGGKDKGGDFTRLIPAIEERASRVLLIGRAADTIYRQLAPVRDRIDMIRDLAEAVRRGYELLRQTGGVVLLAPGCASFDMFENFEHRGEVFRQAVAAFQKAVLNG